MKKKYLPTTYLLRAYKFLAHRKVYLEVITGLLSIPVLITVIVLNISNLREDKKAPEAKTPEKIIVTVPVERPSSKTETTSSNNQPVSPTAEPCKKTLPEINITTPKENESISESPIEVTVSYDKGYCAVVWSYRINQGKWSEYDDKSIAIFNPPKGQITLDLKVKSLATSDEKQYVRKFSYTGTTSPDQQASASGSM